MPRRGSPSPLLIHSSSSSLLIIFSLLLLFFLAILSFTSHKLLPPLPLKKSWDAFNILLVFLAILCGVFSKKQDHDSSSSSSSSTTQRLKHRHSLSGSDGWFRCATDRLSNGGTGALTRLKRTTNSYPDLRHQSFWETANDDRFHRFFDDFEITKYNTISATPLSISSDHALPPNRRQGSESQDSENPMEIPFDTFELRSLKKPSTPPPPPPSPPLTPLSTSKRERRANSTVPRRQRRDADQANVPAHEIDFWKIETPSRTPPPPPPPPPRHPPSEPVEARSYQLEQKLGKRQRKRKNTTNEIKMALASLYNQRKRKRKQRTESHQVEDSISVLACNQSSSPPQPIPPLSPAPPPPPPPPLPPPSVFHSLFRKATKTKRIYSYSTPPKPPPPPQPLLETSLSFTKRWSKRKIQASAPPPEPPFPPLMNPVDQPLRRRTFGRPPLPKKPLPVNNNWEQENVNNTGAQSPLIQMPPPPPPPPFKVPAFRFVMRGDFVKVGSGHSSRCSSPDRDGTLGMESGYESGGTGSVGCPSPDVNVKADTFIARLRDGWKLERTNG
ncbi:hypothetical protein LINPERHAP1_LOCUS22091 [Linum perenne]